MLGVLPGTGGLTRVVDKRKVRRDRADVFCTLEEGIKGRRAVKWRLVDEAVPNSKFDQAVQASAKKLAAQSDRGGAAKGIALTHIQRAFADNGVTYSSVKVEIDRDRRRATVTIQGPDAPPAASTDAMLAQGAAFWPLRLARELDDAILHLRLNEPEIGVLIFKSQGDGAQVLAYDAFLDAHKEHWLAREVLHYWKRVLKRVDLTSRSLVALIEPGSCFAGTLAELVFACDRSFMLDGLLPGGQSPARHARAVAAEFRRLSHEQRSLAARDALPRRARQASRRPRPRPAKPLTAEDCDRLGLVTSVLDHIDWDDEVRIFLEERSSFSADGLTGMEANLRFGGPETMETKIFGRLTAWQNWIFQRPNAAGAEGALKRYGTGVKANFNPERV